MQGISAFQPVYGRFLASTGKGISRNINSDIFSMANLLEKLIARPRGIASIPCGSGTVSNLNGNSHDVTVGGLHNPLATPSFADSPGSAGAGGDRN
jgi:hypothetical protein